MSRKKKALIIDGNNRLYASYFAYDLSYGGQSTSCIYGMPTMIRALLNQINFDKVFIVWDGWGNNKKLRRKILPTYKDDSSRNSLVDLDDLIRQKKIVQELFDALGVVQYMNEDLEGDDTIYALYRTIKHKYSIVLNTGDKDFNQMLKPGLQIYSESKKAVITHKNVKKYFGYTAKETVDYLSLIGDSSDQIPGLRGCGKKTARDLLDKYGSIKDFLATEDEFPRVNREELKRVYKINRHLISLPIFYRKFIKGKRPLHRISARPSLQEGVVRIIAREHGINRFLEPNFIKPFKNE